jgi:hypothetical protein
MSSCRNFPAGNAVAAKSSFTVLQVVPVLLKLKTGRILTIDAEGAADVIQSGAYCRKS